MPPPSRINTSQAFLLGGLCLELSSPLLFLSTLPFSLFLDRRCFNQTCDHVRELFF
jgi:hypothetical protein